MKNWINHTSKLTENRKFSFFSAYSILYEDPLSKLLLTCVWTNKIEEEIISTRYFEWSSVDNLIPSFVVQKILTSLLNEYFLQSFCITF